MNENLGTNNDVLVSNALPDDLQSIDSIAKLNIMSEANSEFSANTPQIMLAQTTTGTIKTWNGDRLSIDYFSGNDAGYFGISEVTGSFRNRLNVEIFGANNIFHDSVSGNYGSTFVFAEGNKLANNTTDCTFINSHYNSFATEGSNNINFVNSNKNYIKGTNFKPAATANNISFYNSNNNVIHPIPTFETIEHENGYTNTKVIPNSFLQNQTFIGSHGNYIKGRTTDQDSFNKPNTTFINTCSSLYDFKNNHNSLTVIGNTLGYINAVDNANIIAIGEGLIQNSGYSDKILLGFYNANSTDPNELLVVGDGRMNREYIKGLVNSKNDWTTDYDMWERVIENTSGTGSTDSDSDYYRHNIFTVNKNGYITISDYKQPSNSARYGFDGITAFIEGESIVLPFSELYTALDGNDAIDIKQDEIDSYTATITEKLNTIPNEAFYPVPDPASIGNNIQLSSYLNLSKPDNDAAVYVDPAFSQLTNNTIITVSYQPRSSRTIPMNVFWSYYTPLEANVTANPVVSSTKIYPYCSKQFILRLPNYPASSENRPFSGITIIS